MLCMAVALARHADRRIGAEQQLGLKSFTHVGVLGEPGCWRGGVVVFGGAWVRAGCWGSGVLRSRGPGAAAPGTNCLPMEAGGGGMQDAGWDATQLAHSTENGCRNAFNGCIQWTLRAGAALIRISSRKSPSRPFETPKTTHRNDSGKIRPTAERQVSLEMPGLGRAR